jgi:hypothetical protein
VVCVRRGIKLYPLDLTRNPSCSQRDFPVTKQEVLEFFGGRQAAADALIVTPQAISAWPDILSEKRINEVVGWGWRHRGAPATRRAFPDVFDPTR